MRNLLIIILFLMNMNGCAFGRPSVAQGSATFSIPFDFIQPEKSALPEEELSQEVMDLEAEMILEKKLQEIKQSEYLYK